jgi:hypothetical protein
MHKKRVGMKTIRERYARAEGQRKSGRGRPKIPTLKSQDALRTPKAKTTRGQVRVICGRMGAAEQNMSGRS